MTIARDRCLFGFIVLSCSVSAWAADAQFEKDGEIFSVGTGTDKGTCTTRVFLDGGQVGARILCVDGDHVSQGSTLVGCEETEGFGICAQTASLTGHSASQLSCSNGDTFNLSSGTSTTTGTCSADGQNGHCIDGTADFAEASCTTGCGVVVGSGCCCKAGTTGCAYGNSCGG